MEQILPMPEEIRITADNYIKAAAFLLTLVLQIPDRLGVQRIHDRNFFTTSYFDTSESAFLYRTRVSAQIVFHLKREHPHLKRLVWKQYGRNFYELTLLRSNNSRELRREIGLRFNVLEFSPQCLFYVAGAFAKAFVKNCIYAKPNP